VGLNGGSCLRGDYFGDGVGLLGGDSALFDRELGDVAGGVDVREPGEAAAQVGGDEAVSVLGDPEDLWPLETGERDHAFGEKRRFRDELELSGLVASRVAAGVEADASFAQQVANGVTC
jgi:hypothetical protein